ncbi:hypothetical protein CEE95_12360, partial [Lactobacillus crispatus]
IVLTAAGGELGEINDTIKHRLLAERQSAEERQRPRLVVRIAVTVLQPDGKHGVVGELALLILAPAEEVCSGVAKSARVVLRLLQPGVEQGIGRIFVPLRFRQCIEEGERPRVVSGVAGLDLQPAAEIMQ